MKISSVIRKSFNKIDCLIRDMDDISKSDDVSKLVRIAFLRFATDLQKEKDSLLECVELLIENLKNEENNRKQEEIEGN